MSKRKDRAAQGGGPEHFEAYGEYAYDWQNPAQEAPLNPSEAVARAKQAHKRKKNSGFFKFLFLLALVTVGIVVVQQTLLRLETVYVIGNELKTAQQVATASGLVRGQNMLGIEEADVAEALSRDHTIIFKGMQKEYPNTIYLYIEERKAAASMQWLGVIYTLDKEGVVMTQENTENPPGGMPVVKGIVGSAINVGQKLSLAEAGQLEAYCAIMEELELQDCAGQIAEINLADPNNIYLLTVEDVTVRMGDASIMRAKIGSINTVMAQLRQWGETGGILDVTTPEKPKYRPLD